jgi:hypothetical protein
MGIEEVVALLPLLEAGLKAIEDAIAAAKAKDAAAAIAALEQADAHLTPAFDQFKAGVLADRAEVDAQLKHPGAPATTEPKP